MKIKKITIENFRLLQHVELMVEDDITLVVGKNNTGKTSFMNFLQMVLDDSSSGFTFDDYPVSLRDKIYDFIMNSDLEHLKENDAGKVFLEPLIKLNIDYSSEDENSPLGSLSPFVIDLDSAITTAIIDIRYRLIIPMDELIKIIKAIRSDEKYDIPGDNSKKDLIRKYLSSFFPQYYKLKITAVNPTNLNDYQEKSKEDIKRLLSIYYIRAERAMDESDDGNKKPLEKLLNRIFIPITDIDSQADLEGQRKKELFLLRSDLQKIVTGLNSEINEKIDKKMADLISKSIVFGYPNTEEVSLSAKANIKLLDQVRRNTDLWYVDTGSEEMLPSHFNGLGYKNLLKIEFELVNYLASAEEDANGRLYLLFIEEPESHMHPQLQQSFISFLNEFIKSLSNKKIQTLITTHSSHIANKVSFTNIRYAKRDAKEVIFKDLKAFSEEKPKNAEFIYKYLSLYRCDLFFADKTILYEGSSERLLLPAMINNLATEGEYKSASIGLDKQYVTFVEVGGAHGYLFFDFLKFLGIPSLIITDIDSVDNDRKSTPVKHGTTTSNSTIKWWMKNYLGKNDEISMANLLCLTEKEKTKDKIHLAYQVEENGLVPRSLEDAIINSNREIFNVPNPANEEDIVFKNGSKTDFALKLLFENSNFSVPQYIKKGLLWLNTCKVIEVSDDE